MKSSIWYEKYKPEKVQDLVLPEDFKQKLQGYVDKKDIPSLGLWSPVPGGGKSSTAHAIIKEMGSEALWINASLERGIDTLRGKIQNFASASSFDDNLKIVVCDESDGVSLEFMAAMRGFISEFSANCRFILTGNYPDKIIEPLLNRLENYDFDNFNKKDMIKPIFEKLKYILEQENIKYDPKDVAGIIQASYPSIRGMISNLQKFSTTGELVFNTDDLDNSNTFDNVMQSASYMDLIQNVNSLSSPSAMFSFLYQNIQKYFKQESLGSVVISLAKYQEMNSNVRDKHLNLGACLSEIWQHRK